MALPRTSDEPLGRDSRRLAACLAMSLFLHAGFAAVIFAHHEPALNASTPHARLSGRISVASGPTVENGGSEHGKTKGRRTLAKTARPVDKSSTPKGLSESKEPVSLESKEPAGVVDMIPDVGAFFASAKDVPPPPSDGSWSAMDIGLSLARSFAEDRTPAADKISMIRLLIRFDKNGDPVETMAIREDGLQMFDDIESVKKTVMSVAFRMSGAASSFVIVDVLLPYGWTSEGGPPPMVFASMHKDRGRGPLEAAAWPWPPDITKAIGDER